MSLIAFETRTEPPGLEIRVNFGMFAGREATPAELDELAQALLPEVAEVSVVAEHRHEVGRETEATVHQVRVEIALAELPETDVERARLAQRLVDVAERWAEACIADRHAEVAEI
jgi:hypothetical protein